MENIYIKQTLNKTKKKKLDSRKKQRREKKTENFIAIKLCEHTKINRCIFYGKTLVKFIFKFFHNKARDGNRRKVKK